MEEKINESSNNTLIGFIIFFSLFLFFIIFLFIYDNYNGNNIIYNQIDSVDNYNIINKVDDNKLLNIKNILEDELFINLIVNKTNISDINNNDLLNYFIELAIKQSQYNSATNIAKEVINDLHKESLFKNISITHTNIIKNNNIYYNYINDYYIRENINHFIENLPKSIIVDIFDIKKLNNYYYISYKYAFIKDNKVYPSYIDAINNVNIIKENYINNDNYEMLKKELKNNSNLKTYTYKLEEENNKFILKEFNVNK